MNTITAHMVTVSTIPVVGRVAMDRRVLRMHLADSLLDHGVTPTAVRLDALVGFLAPIVSRLPAEFRVSVSDDAAPVVEEVVA